ncbi:MAG: ribosomal protein bL12 [Sphingobacterium sp.]
MANQLRKLGVRVEVTTMQSEESDKKYLVRLLSVGKNEIKVIKVVRELTGLGLKEAKLIVDKLGILVEKLSKNRAESIGRLLEAAGARVRIEEMSIPEPEPDPGAEDFKTIYANFTDESGKTLVKFNIDLYEENIQEWLLLFDRFKDRGEK